MSQRLVRFILALGVGCVSLVRAEDAVPEPKAPAYVLKNKSNFSAVNEDLRAPFWPIGWVKRKPMQASASAAQVVEAPKVLFDEKNFKVTSILLGNPSLAIINGRTYGEGESLRATGAPGVTAAAIPQSARVRVYRINDGSVILQNQEQMITIALQRPELIQRSNVEQLLNEDRP